MLNEFKGTPGPWLVDPQDKTCVASDVHDLEICTIQPVDVSNHFHYGAVSDANAKLIAASPKLFKAVNDFLNHFEGNIPLWLFEEAEGAVAEALGK